MNTFHDLLLKHLLSSENVFKYNWLEFWNHFSENNMLDKPGNELRSEMINNILPRIYTFSLTEEQRNYLKILRHDFFLNEDNEGFTLIRPRSEAEGIKIIFDKLRDKVIFFYFFVNYESFIDNLYINLSDKPAKGFSTRFYILYHVDFIRNFVKSSTCASCQRLLDFCLLLFFYE